ncbi:MULTISPECIES: aminoglycoside phosphotransferase [unclassified Streptomyces]|uniref:aminoglycoside phosphotransferase n=1 Tax=unclassified Streptomyces TaxID=2593676 RepID=UPI002DD90905|nr:aminoglycoside phosphotransferase [Streptomyces sp. NBC_01766]WSC24661.1 aminoglycoside phosphotransferase [Streptomyces sp. NBC_01766]WSV55215.1 aminoglycoside phosphotransferase [Streptomyces sp. NBC_01014]
MRLHWNDLPAGTRDAVAARTGPVHAATTVGRGLNSEIAATLSTGSGRVFVKGLRCDHPRVWTQQREAVINPYVAPLAPRLVWRIDDGEWNLLGFEYLDGRPADYKPGSADLPLIADVITALSAIRAPADIELKQIEDRFADYLDNSDDARQLSGNTLLHTDWTPDNVLIVDGVARVVDWAWPTRGAAWIDAACWAVWLIASGHTPHDAEAWAARTPGWAGANARALDVFTIAQQRLWSSIAADAPDVSWKRGLADAAACWAAYRRGGRKEL